MSSQRPDYYSNQPSSSGGYGSSYSSSNSSSSSTPRTVPTFTGSGSVATWSNTSAPSLAPRVQGSQVGNSAVPARLLAQLLLPCEFRDIMGCKQTFSFGNIDGWYEHIGRHLRNKFPAYSLCWFCDDVKFDSSVYDGDAGYTFFLRLQHIRDEHIAWNMTVQQKRPDFFLVDHLYQNGLIDDRTLAKMKKKNELPLPADVYDSKFQPPKGPEKGVPYPNERRSRRGRH